MCGIGGFSFKQDMFSEGQRAILAATLGRLNDRRGGTSWGIYIPDEKNYRIIKGLGTIAENVHRMVGLDEVMLHTRLKTTGEGSVQNAHPFTIGNIIGSHNGVLNNHYELNNRYSRSFEVDSMHIFAHLNEDKPLDEIKGYGTIQWVEKNYPNMMYLCNVRNGSLSIVTVGKDPNKPEGVVWSSDEDHLLEALIAAGIEDFEYVEAKEGEVYCVYEGDIFTVDKQLSFGSGYGDYGHYSRWEDFQTEKEETQQLHLIEDNKEELEIEVEFENPNDNERKWLAKRGESLAWEEYLEMRRLQDEDNGEGT